MELKVLEKSSVSDTDNKSVTDHLVTSVTVVTVVRKSVQLHDIGFSRLAILLISLVKSSSFKYYIAAYHREPTLSG